MRFFAPSKMQSVKDMPSELHLKFRQEGQNTAAELRGKDLRSDLEEKERQHALKNKPARFEGAPRAADARCNANNSTAACSRASHCTAHLQRNGRKT